MEVAELLKNIIKQQRIIEVKNEKNNTSDTERINEQQNQRTIEKNDLREPTKIQDNQQKYT